MSTPIDQTIRKAERLQKRGQFDAAARLYNDVLKKFPGNARARAGLQTLPNTSSKTPLNADLAQRIEELKELLENDDFDTLLKTSEALCHAYPTEAFIHHLRGSAFLKLGQKQSAVDAFLKAAEFQPNAGAFYNLGVAQKLCKYYDDALKSLLEADKLKPGVLNTQIELAAVLFTLGRYQETVERYQSAIQIDPNRAGYHFNLGNTYVRLKEYLNASKAYQNALNLDPRNKFFHYNLGVALQKMNALEQATKAFRNVLRLDNTYVEAHVALAGIYKDLHMDDASETAFRNVISMTPEHGQAHYKLCEILDRTGQADRLRDAINHASRHLDPDDELLMLPMVTLAHREDRYHDAKAILERMPESKVADTRKHHAELLGKTYDRLGDYENAFAQYEKHNSESRLKGDGSRLEDNSYFQRIDKALSAWSSAKNVRWSPPNFPPLESDLVFLVGFPRSGTTLLDTILRGHPDIEVLEEKRMTHRMAVKIDHSIHPDTLSDLSDAQLFELRETYLKLMSEELDDGAQRSVIIDKLPLNLAMAGLLHRVFPEAKFILALRHPCDCVLSCYMQSFVLNEAMTNFLDLKHSARLYHKVMALWLEYNRTLPLSSFQIRYEDIVEDVSGACTPLLKFIGLDWVERQKNFQKTAFERGRINTPSYNQVTKPIYKQAKGRWENYRDQMQPALPLLLPWAQHFGYDIGS